MIHVFTAAALSLAIVGSTPALSAQAASRPAGGEPTLEEVRAATERFRDVNVALAEGYIRDPMNMCVTAEMEARPATEGGMGVHYLRPDLLGIAGPPDPRVNGTSTHTDFRRPAILIYEPQADGSLELVAVENLVFQKAWEAAGNAEPPSFHGLAYDHMVDDPRTPADEAHGFEPHYDRHVWLYRENPLGVFAPFNPAVTCEHYGQATEHGPDSGHHAVRWAEGYLTPAEFAAIPSQPADHRIAYGEDPSQFGELRVPASPGPHPAAILVHGGSWRDFATLRTLAPLADALKVEGVATWNVEFRRLSEPGSGWPGTFLDIGRAVDHLRHLAPQHDLDLDRVVVVGHSAGVLLATWAAARTRLPEQSELYVPDPLRVHGVVALGNAAHLEEYISPAAGPINALNVAALMGGTPDEVTERYAHASSVHLLPLGVPQHLIIGAQDSRLNLQVMERYADAARRAGDRVRLFVVPNAGHFEAASPLASSWPVVSQAIHALLSRAQAQAAAPTALPLSP